MYKTVIKTCLVSTLFLGMYQGQFFTEYRVIRQSFAKSGYRVFNKLEKLADGGNAQPIQDINIYYI